MSPDFSVGDDEQAETSLGCELHDWVEVREVLQMHGWKRTAVATKRGQDSYQARRARLEARMQREKGESHD